MISKASRVFTGIPDMAVKRLIPFPVEKHRMEYAPPLYKLFI
ncbi:hypothetical protein T01_1689 [Trichinella spiralis]|uniref:Uncharacterized protein n=1 Tax=Trichinella spiralis TaxID=6334 RepID=A0A0V0YXR6_TRISP|nr:hypothetical protein T01_1689 [Trichinella spiralis]